MSSSCLEEGSEWRVGEEGSVIWPLQVEEYIPKAVGGDIDQVPGTQVSQTCLYELYHL